MLQDCTCVAAGRSNYDPEPGFAVTDRFTYSTTDFYGDSNLTTVTLEVQAATAQAGPPDTRSTRPPASLAFTG